MALDSTNQRNTVTEIQQLLPPSINATIAEGNLHVVAVPHRSFENPMDLLNILLEENDTDIPPLPSLDSSEVSNTPAECPGTPVDFDSLVEAMPIYPEEYIWDNFDVVDWPSWMDNDVLSSYD